jgi:polyisoprenoid-binding protein YceI
MLTNHGAARIIFMARGPVGLSFVGKSEQVVLKEEHGEMVVSLRLDSLNTGISFRDDHMRDRYLETAKFPEAVLRVDRSQLQWPEAGPVQAKVKGKLTLHGVTRTVTIAYQAEGTCHHARIEATLHLNMKSFKIETPVHLGMTVRPGIDISLKMGVIDL